MLETDIELQVGCPDKELKSSALMWALEIYPYVDL